MAVSLDMLAVIKKMPELRRFCPHARQAQYADEDWTGRLTRMETQVMREQARRPGNNGNMYSF